jgi:glycosyltransferase involved in cell wall biosynthesis
MPSRAQRCRILLVTNWIGWAGAETQLAHLAIGLSRAGHRVTLLGIGTIVRDLGPLRDAGVEVVALGATRPPAKLRRLPGMVRMARAADVVHCTGWDASLWGRLAAALARRPALVTEHTPGRDMQVTEKGTSRGRLIALHNRLLDRFTYATIAVGAWQADLLRDEGVRAESIVHIPNAVPVAELRERAARGPARETLGVPEAAPLLVHVARFSAQKGQGTTLRAAASLRRRFGDVHVAFVGEGGEEAKVRAEAAAIGAGEWAHFLGRRDDVPGLLAAADLSVLPSMGEGLPMSQIEALAVGTPVVATDVGDIRWLLEMSGGGICVLPGDEDAFRAACADLLEHPERRRRLAAAALAAAPGFDAPLMVSRYERLLTAAAAREPLATAAAEVAE